ncbi:MAG TPA: HD domain-containing phosphohydrolase [Anaerovoracaceae bacterium]|nr:HD domain-containing phosphohydrolase [Anaerovoracaceae bacterium]
MIGNFITVPIAALICYTFLLVAFMSAKRTRLINSFLIVLGALILWTGGSFCMRMLLWPSVEFWYDISIAGLTLLPFAFFNFVQEFVGSKDSLAKKIWLLLVVAVNVINISTGALLAPPVLRTSGRELGFVYDPTWAVGILFGVCVAIVIHMLYVLVKNSQKNELVRKQFTPIILGIMILFAGHLFIMFSIFRGFPTDILSGVINAFFMFYALYKRRLFKPTLLVSRGICYIVTLGLAVLIFANAINSVEGFIQGYFGRFAQYDVLIIAVLFTFSILLIYYAIKKFIDHVFIKEEILRAESLNKFSYAVSKSLRIDEILEELAGVIQHTIGVKRVYVCVADAATGVYTIAHSTSPLGFTTFCLQKDNPLVEWLTEHSECLQMKDFKRTMAYKSMWETEKKQLAELNIECMAPLKDEDQLIGIVLLSGKERSGGFTYDDVSFLASVDSIGSIAVKNSKLYEKVYYEARTDELTGLLNRKYFYETIQEEYQKHKNHSLALVILNIDDFKLYNQLYGNKEGDIALQRVAQIIRATVGSNGYVARYGGKEFAVILPMYDILSAKTLAENIRKQILNMNKRARDYTLKVLTVSGGICAIPYSASTVKQLIDNADMAVYHAKRKGKNIILTYSVEKKELGMQAEGAKQENRADIYAEYAPTIYALTAAIDAKDHYTFNHSKRVAYYATKLAYAYGMEEDFVRIIKEAALLHDIGKIGIPEQILNKEGKLTTEEFETIKNHVENSIGIIRHLPSLDYVIPAIIGHHERYDGRGYPRRIAKEDIPISARMLCIADSFDAMTSQRVYRPALPVDQALQILEEEAGRQFDPVLVPIFVHMVKNGLINVDEEMIKVYEEEA